MCTPFQCNCPSNRYHSNFLSFNPKHLRAFSQSTNSYIAVKATHSLADTDGASVLLPSVTWIKLELLLKQGTNTTPLEASQKLIWTCLNLVVLPNYKSLASTAFHVRRIPEPLRIISVSAKCWDPISPQILSVHKINFRCSWSVRNQPLEIVISKPVRF